VLRDSRELVLGGGRQRSLLAVLLVHANEVVSNDRLIDEVWGGRPPETAGTALHGVVSQLRKALEPERPAGSPGAVLVTRSPGYVLRVDPDLVDAARFERLLGEGRAALDSGEAGRAAATLRDALVLWRGRALDGADHAPSAHAEAMRLEELRVEALEERIDADLALGRDEELVPELEAIVEREPLRERLQGQLMLALYRSGRQADALERYQHARNTFRDRLGIELSPRLRELEQAMLRQDPELDEGLPRVRPRRVLRRRRRTAVAAIVVALLALAAIAAGVLFARSDAPLQGKPGSVAVVDPEAARVVDTIEVGSGPAAIVFGHGSVWVANSEDDTVSRIDPETREVVKVIGVPSPVDLAVGADAIWVAGGLEGTVSRIDVELEDVVAEVDLGGDDPVQPMTVQGVATSPGAAWACVGTDLVRIDLETNEPDAHLDVRQGALAASYGDGFLWVATAGSSLLRVEPASLAVTARGAIPGFPHDVVATDDGIVVLAQTFDTSYRSGAWLVDPATARFVRTIADAGTVLSAADVQGPGLWVSGYVDDKGAAARVVPESPRADAVVATGQEPSAVTVGGGLVWVALRASEL
jgi:YVTN family beta-propeller protein